MNKTKQKIPHQNQKTKPSKCMTLYSARKKRWMEQVSAVRNQKLMERKLSAHTGDIPRTLILRL